jgi:hypothetical protein
MLPKENANEMYSHLNVIVEELNGLGLNQMSPADVARKILCVLPIEKYGHIVTVLQQGDLSTATPTSILGKINAHEMYMHSNPQDSSSSTKKEKDLALKASQDFSRESTLGVLGDQTSPMARGGAHRHGKRLSSRSTSPRQESLLLTTTPRQEPLVRSSLQLILIHASIYSSRPPCLEGKSRL